MLRVFAIQIQEHFRFEAEWYRTGVVAGLVLQYYALLRSVLETRPALRRCLTRCRHCRIFFVAAPSNEERQIGCAFGCADEHRKRQWQQTSKKYYQSPEGKKRKSQHNQRQRDRRKGIAALEKVSAPPPPPPPPPPPSAPKEKKIPARLVSYVQRVVSGIEGRRVSREEVVEMLAKEKSQHSLVRQRRIDQIMRSLHERPP